MSARLVSVDASSRLNVRLTFRPMFHPGAWIKRTVSPAFHPCLKVAASGLVVLLSECDVVPKGESAQVPQSPNVASAVSS